MTDAGASGRRVIERPGARHEGACVNSGKGERTGAEPRGPRAGVALGIRVALLHERGGIDLSAGSGKPLPGRARAGDRVEGEDGQRDRRDEDNRECHGVRVGERQQPERRQDEGEQRSGRVTHPWPPLASHTVTLGLGTAACKVATAQIVCDAPGSASVCRRVGETVRRCDRPARRLGVLEWGHGRDELGG